MAYLPPPRRPTRRGHLLTHRHDQPSGRAQRSPPAPVPGESHRCLDPAPTGPGSRRPDTEAAAGPTATPASNSDDHHFFELRVTALPPADVDSWATASAIARRTAPSTAQERRRDCVR